MNETTVVSADGTPLAARCSGRGSPLVLVHGALGDLNTFAPLEAPLAEHHTVWVYSRRNRGGSGDGPSYSIEREAEDVLAVVDAAGGDVHLFGHSAGGAYAMLAAQQASRLRSVLLYEAALRTDRMERVTRERMEAALADGDAAGAIEAFVPAAGITAEELAAIRSLEPVWEALQAGVPVFPRELRALQQASSLLSRIGLPDVPLLWLHGELTESVAYPTASEIAARFPRAELHRLSGQRHLAPMFDPATFAQVMLAFTARVDRDLSAAG
ncbi:MAG TPA: alpha/beta hydrolase [Pseudomonadales bacterium]